MSYDYKCYFCNGALLERPNYIKYIELDCKNCKFLQNSLADCSAFSLMVYTENSNIYQAHIRFRSLTKSISLYFDLSKFVIWDFNHLVIEPIIISPQSNEYLLSILSLSPAILENKIKTWITFS